MVEVGEDEGPTQAVLFSPTQASPSEENVGVLIQANKIVQRHSFNVEHAEKQQQQNGLSAQIHSVT